MVFDCNKLDLYSHLVKDKNGTIRRKTDEETKAETKKIEMNEQENSATQETIVKKIPTNKEILESVRNKVKEENEMKLVYRPFTEGIEQQTATVWE